MTFKSRFIDGSDATEYQAAIAPIVSEIADAVSEADEIPLEWAELWAAMDKRQHPWVLTTENMYHRMLEVLPPQDMSNGGFLVGEPQYHNAAGEAVYACFTFSSYPFGGCYQARYMTGREFKKWKSIRA